MSSTNAVRVARARAKRLELRLVQRIRGELCDLVDGSDEVVHTGSLEATNAYLLARARNRPPGPSPASAPSLWRPALQILKRELQAARQSDGTIRFRIQNLATFAKRHPGSDPRYVSRDELAHYLSNPDFSNWYAHSLRTTFRVFFRTLQEQGFREDNPAARLPAVRIPRSLPRPCPDGAVLYAIENAKDPRVRLAIRVGAEAGLRRAEIARMRRADVEGWPGSYSVRVIGKGGHERVVPISDSLADELKDGDTIHVFSGPGGHVTPHYLGRLIAKALPDKWTAHTLRHRMASKAYQHSRDLRAVQELLGHHSPTTTAIYTQSDDASRRNAIEAARIE